VRWLHATRFANTLHFALGLGEEVGGIRRARIVVADVDGEEFGEAQHKPGSCPAMSVGGRGSVECLAVQTPLTEHSRGIPGIKDRHAKTTEVFYVARNDRQAVLQRGCGDLAVEHMKWFPRKLPLTL
jgi:hypothetical protein